MPVITGSFADMWTELATVARENGALDADLYTIRAKVKALLVSAGWLDASGQPAFASDSDAAHALQAARNEVIRAAKVSSDRARLREALPGSAPSMASLSSSASYAHVHSAVSADKHVSAAFSPRFAQIGDKCPRCSAAMTPVGLANQKAALYCTQDRVVIPLAPDAQV